MAHSIKSFLTKSVVDIAQSTEGLEIGGDVISPTLTAAIEVGSRNIVRITVTAGAAMHVAFGISSMAAVTAATSPATRLPVSAVEQVYYLLATGDFIRADVVATRVEVIHI